MSLKDNLQKDLIEAMKAKDSVKVSTLRMVKSAIMKHEVSGKDAVADDEVVMAIIQKEAKSRKESIDQFRKGGREDLVEGEEAELKILEAYLPEQMSEEEVAKIVEETIAQVGAAGPGDMGKVMGAIMPKVKGKADGGIINRLVREKLQN